MHWGTGKAEAVAPKEVGIEDLQELREYARVHQVLSMLSIGGIP